jgi:uncharacterized protein YbjT (DUF2867 family)
MTTAVIGGTGHVGSEIVHGLLERGDEVAKLVRDQGEARRAFRDPDGLYIRQTRVGARPYPGIRWDPHSVHRDGIGRDRGRPATDRDQRRRRNLLDRTGHPRSVLNTSADSRGINQRARYSIDQFASSTGVPYSTIHPAIGDREPGRLRRSPGSLDIGAADK